MPNMEIPQVTLALTAQGGTSGILQVADTSEIYPGAIVWLSDNTGVTVSLELMVTEIIDTTHFRARVNTKDSTKKMFTLGSNLSAFTVGNASYVVQEAQLCPVEANMSKKLSIP